MNVLVLGGTGLVGSELVNLLSEDNRVQKIDLISRRELVFRDMKVTNHMVDFDIIEELPIYHNVEILYVAFGTTIKKAGSVEKQWEIDVEIPTKIMKLAKDKGVKTCVFISAMGVHEKSPFPFSRMKAQLEVNAKAVGFDKLIMLKPSILEGVRIENRPGERISLAIGNAIAKTGMIDKYKPVEAIDVARCMIQSNIELENGVHEIPSEQIEEFSIRYFPEAKSKLGSEED